MYGFEYNDKVSFLGKNKLPYFLVIGFNARKQVFLKTPDSTWSVDYRIVNIERTPLFKVTNIKTDYTNLPLFEECLWSQKNNLL